MIFNDNINNILGSQKKPAEYCSLSKKVMSERIKDYDIGEEGG